MNALQNIAVGVAVTIAIMACMVFGHWLARGKAQPDHHYCQNIDGPERNELGAANEGSSADQKKARKEAKERNHELCQQWRSAQSAEETTHVTWLQMWIGVGGLIGLGLTVFFTGLAAKGASDAAKTAEKSLTLAERAFLAVKPHGVVPFEPAAHSDVHIGIENVGNLPARNVRWCISSEMDSDGRRTNFPLGTYHGSNVVPPGTDMHQSARNAFTQTEWDAFKGNATFLYVWGRVEYDDGFGGPLRHTDFCHRYDSRGFGRARQRPYNKLHAIHLEGVRYHEHGNDAT